MKKLLLIFIYILSGLSLLAQNVELTFQTGVLNDTLFLTYQLGNKVGSEFVLGDANFKVLLDTNSLDHNNAVIYEKGFWSDETIVDYYEESLAVVPGDSALNLSISPLLSRLSDPAPVSFELANTAKANLAIIAIPIKVCSSDLKFDWDKVPASNGSVLDWDGSLLNRDFISPASISNQISLSSVSVTKNISTLCPKDVVEYTVQVAPASLGQEYLFKQYNAAAGNYTVNSVVDYPNTKYEYTNLLEGDSVLIEVKEGALCPNVIVERTPVTSITNLSIAETIDDGCSPVNGEINLNYTASNPGGESLQWKYNGADISGSIASTLNGTFYNGIYHAEISLEGCVWQSDSLAVISKRRPRAEILTEGYKTNFCFPGDEVILKAYPEAGKAVEVFNGAYVDIDVIGSDLNLSANDNYTIELQAKVSSAVSTRNTLFYAKSATETLELLVDNNGVVKVSYNGIERITSLSPITLNDFEHFAVSFDNQLGVITLYQKGVVTGVFSIPSFTPNASDITLLHLGKNESGNSLNAFVDEFRFWKGVVSPEGVLHNFGEELEGNEPNLSVYLDFNDETSGLVLDKALGDANNASLLNGAKSDVYGFYTNPSYSQSKVYQWTPANGTTQVYAAVDSLIVTPNNVGLFKLKVKNGSCTEMVSFEVEDINFDFDLNYADGQYCLNDDLLVTANQSLIPPTVDSSSWSTGDLNMTSINVLVDQYKEIYVKADSAGCSAYDTLKISIKPNVAKSIKAPVLTHADLDSVVFNWNAVNNVDFYDTHFELYRANVLNSTESFISPEIIQTKYKFTNLVDGDSILFSYRVESCDTIYSDTVSVVVALCNSTWSGLKSDYCSASSLSILNPEKPGGQFIGEGIGYDSEVFSYVFDPYNVAVGNYMIAYVDTDCDDTTYLSTMINAAPCNEELIDPVTYPFLDEPQGIITTCDGDVFVTSTPTGNVASTTNLIVKVDKYGQAEVFAGNVDSLSKSKDGLRLDAILNKPLGITADDQGNLFFVDNGSNLIRMYEAVTDSIKTISGIENINNVGSRIENGVGNAVRFKDLSGITISSAFDKLYVVEGSESGDKSAIREIELVSGDYNTSTIIGGTGASTSISNMPIAGISAVLISPAYITSSENVLFITDQINPTTSVVYEYDVLTQEVVLKTTLNSSVAKGLTADCSGNLFLADNGFNAIKYADFDSIPNDVVVTIPADNMDGINQPVDVSLYAKGFVDVANRGTKKVLRYQIADYKTKPWRGVDSIYCIYDEPDTIDLKYACSLNYSGVGLYKDLSGNIIFDPSLAGEGLHTLSYEFTVGTCSETISKTVRVNPSPSFDLGTDQEICYDPENPLKVSVNAQNDIISYDWRRINNDSIVTAIDDTVIFVVDSGYYELSVSNTSGCTYVVDTIHVTYKLVDKFAQPNATYLCAGEEYSRNAFLFVFDNLKNNTFKSAVWQDSTVAPVYTTKESGLYYAEIELVNSCKVDLYDTVYFYPENDKIEITTDGEEQSLYVKKQFDLSYDAVDFEQNLEGDFYVVDQAGNKINLVKKEGSQLAFAGAGANGFANNTDPLLATFNSPSGISVSQNGNVFIADAGNHLIRMVDVDAGTNEVKTVLGTGVAGYKNGHVDSAQVNNPVAVAVSGNGYIYIVDQGNGAVRLFDSKTKTLSTIGVPNGATSIDGDYLTASFTNPTSIDIDVDGRIIIGEENGVRVIDPISKVVSTLNNGNTINIGPDSFSDAIKDINTWGEKGVFALSGNSVFELGLDKSANELTDTSGTAITFLSPLAITNGDDNKLFVSTGGASKGIQSVYDSSFVNICVNDTVVLRSNATSTGTYKWVKPSGAFSNADTVLAWEEGMYVLEFTDALTSCKSYDSIQINIYSYPSEDLLSDTTICYDDQINVYGVSQGDSIYMTSNVFGIAPQRVVDSLSVLVDSSQVGEYYFEFDNGICQVVDTVNVSVTTLTPEILAIDGTILPDTVCYADTLVLSGTFTSGGVQPYSYQWTMADANDQYSSLTDPVIGIVSDQNGFLTYEVLVTDAAGCYDTDTIEIFNNKPLSVAIQNLVKDTVTMCITELAYVDLAGTLSGGRAPYSYKWEATDPNLLLLASGTDTTQNTRVIPKGEDNDVVGMVFEVTDSLGCVNSDTAHFILESFVVDIIPDYDTICPVLEDTLTMSIVGGSGDYNITWFGNNVTPDLSNIDTAMFISHVEGVFSADGLVEDVLKDTEYIGCAIRVEKDIVVEKAKAVIADINGHETFDFFVCEDDTLTMFSTLSEGLYGAELSFDWGKITSTTDEFITAIDTLSDSAIVANGLLGTISTYELIVVDSIGCKDTANATVYWNDQLDVNLPSDTVYVCDNGSSLLNGGQPTGGASNANEYIYQWSIINSIETSAQLVGNTNQQDVSIDFNLASTYDTAIVLLEVFDTLGCHNQDTLVVIATKLAVTGVVVYDTICPGFSNVLEVGIDNGGFGPYNYSWELGGVEESALQQYLPIKTTEQGYKYFITVTDQTTSCVAIDSVFYVVKGITPVITSSSHLNPFPVCYGDTIQVSAINSSGGKRFADDSYLYKWEDLETSTQILLFDTLQSVDLVYLPTQVDTISYRLTIEDSVGCSESQTIEVIWNSKIEINTVSDTTYSCVPLPASLEVDETNTTGGTFGYSFQWSNAEGKTITNADQKIASINLIDNDVIHVFLEGEDIYGCKGYDTLVAIGVDFTVEANAKYGSTCKEVSDTLYVTYLNDAFGPYNYEWISGAFLSDPLKEKTGATPQANTTYSVTVEDTKTGCFASDDVTLIIEGLNAQIDPLTTTLSCYGDAPLEYSASNSTEGVPFTQGDPYQYSWTSNSVGLEIIGPDAVIVAVDTGTVSRGGVSTIYLTIEDSVGCTGIDSIEAIWNTRVLVNALKDSVFVCNPNSALLQNEIATGGAPSSIGYKYLWQATSFNSLTNEETLSASISVSNNVETKAWITATDSLGCIGTDTVTVLGLDFTIEAIADFDKVCEEVKDTLRINYLEDGLGTYRYSWSPITGLDDPSIETPAATINGATTYSVEVTDQKSNCIANSSVSIEYYEPTVDLNISGDGKNYKCIGETFLFIQASSTTENGSITYDWSSSNTSLTPNVSGGFYIIDDNGTQIIRPEVLSVYVKATDDIGCVANDTIVSYWNDTLKVDIIPSWKPYLQASTGFEFNFVCEDVDNIITSDVQNGFTPYNYTWTLNETGASNAYSVVNGFDDDSLIFNVSTSPIPAQIKLAIIDSLGCAVSSSDFDVSSQNVAVDLIVSADTVCPDVPVLLTATDSEAFEDLNTPKNVAFSWDNGLTYQNQNTISLIPPVGGEKYIVTVIDSITGCTAQDSGAVIVSDLLVDFTSLIDNSNVPTGKFDELCFGDEVTFNGVKTSGGKKPYSYEWVKNSSSIESNTSIVTSSFTASEIGLSNGINYTLTVEDFYGCIRDTTLELKMNAEMFADASSLTNSLPQDDGKPYTCQFTSVLVGGAPSGSGGTNNFSYDWNNLTVALPAEFGVDNVQKNSEKPVFNSLGGFGEYSLELTVSDKAVSHCNAKDIVEISVKKLPEADFTSVGINDTVTACAGEDNFLDPGDYTDYGTNQPSFKWEYDVEIPFTTNKKTIALTELVEPTVEGYYSVYVKDVFGCENNDTGYVAQSESAVALIIDGTDFKCNNASITLTMDTTLTYVQKTDKISWKLLDGEGQIIDTNNSVVTYHPSSFDKAVTISLTHTNLCSDSTISTSLSFSEAPTAGVSVNNQYIHAESEVEYFNTSSGSDLIYDWEIEISDVESLYETTKDIESVYYEEEGDFVTTLMVIDTVNQCSDTSTIMINVSISHILYVPNVMSTKAVSGENRRVKVYGEGIDDEGFYFGVYNRWGDLIYETNSKVDAQEIGWDGVNRETGEIQESGVFTYVLRGLYGDGQSFDKTGTITLIK